ncbi:MAG TPA: CARDB domain-containing protein [Gaiella sp.]
MSIHDDDILDFDFVDDETQERTAPTRPSGDGVRGGGRPPRGPQGPRLRAPQGITPLLRLIGLIAFAIVVVVLLVVWVQGCSNDKQRDDYNAYMTDIGAVGSDSEQIGEELATLLTTPGLKQAVLEQKLAGFIQQQELDVQRAQDVDSPGPLTPAHEQAIEALQLRVSGMQGLLTTFKTTASAKDATAAGQRLSTQGSRLEASDVVWQDLFRAQATQVTLDEGVEGVTAPPSVFVQNAELYSTRSMTSIWQRVHGASTGGTPTGAHGSGLAYTKALPSGQQLSTSTETTIETSTELGFEVGVTNTGENQEVGVEVTLTIPKATSPIVRKGTIDVIDPGETKTVRFSELPEVDFGERTTVQVSVKPVAGETNTGNNSAEYPVIFSLG